MTEVDHKTGKKPRQHKKKQTDYDTPWKDAIEFYFRDFMDFYFPEQAIAMDWSKPCRFLNQELAKSIQNARVGKRVVDRLVEVALLDGGEAWVYIHIELQGQRETGFTERLFVYNYRAYDRFRRPVATLVLLLDDEPGWKPGRYGFEVLGTRHYLEFPVVKLLDFRHQVDTLPEQDNPFALVTVAHLLSRQTRNDARQRYAAKFRLIELLGNKGWAESKIHRFIGIIDWLLHLPDELNQQLWQAITQTLETATMPYVSSFERYAIQKGMDIGKQLGIEQGMEQGMEQGLLQGERAVLLRLITKRFGTLSPQFEQRLMQANQTQLECWADRVLEARSVDTVFADFPETE